MQRRTSEGGDKPAEGSRLLDGDLGEVDRDSERQQSDNDVVPDIGAREKVRAGGNRQDEHHELAPAELVVSDER